MVKIILGIVILIILFFVGFFVGSFAKQYYCYIKNKKNILETELETESGYVITMKAATDWSVYHKFTPWGDLKFDTLNKEAAEQLTPGKQYIIQILEEEQKQWEN